MSELCPTLGSLIELGFEHREPLYVSDTVGYQFAQLNLTASHMMNMYARYVVVLGGTIDTGRTFTVVDHQIPDNLENSLEAAAWISYALSSNRRELEPLPDWFIEGERHWDLVPMVRQQQEAEEKNRAYSASPRCYIYRDYARPLRRNLMEHFGWLSEETEMTISFDGLVLGIVLEERTHEVVASGDNWPSSFRVIVSPQSKLPARFDSEMVEVNVFEGFVRFDGIRLGPCEPVS